MKKLLTIICTAIFCTTTLHAQTDTDLLSPVKISIFDGTVTLEMKKSVTPFHSIGLRFTDMYINRGSGSYVEIRQRGAIYIIADREYEDLEIGLQDFLKTYLEDEAKLSKEYFDEGTNSSREYFSRQNLPETFYDDIDVYWNEFLEEDKVQEFINLIKERIDEESLIAPFNEEWG
ncbi:MAG: hypothetical protein FWC39_12505 [Bacteroidetes bacterium]|nr:hypothetical protein [Bacteroidota bacterium]